MKYNVNDINPSQILIRRWHQSITRLTVLVQYLSELVFCFVKEMFSDTHTPTPSTLWQLGIHRRWTLFRTLCLFCSYFISPLYKFYYKTITTILFYASKFFSSSTWSLLPFTPSVLFSVVENTRYK